MNKKSDSVKIHVPQDFRTQHCLGLRRRDFDEPVRWKVSLLVEEGAVWGSEPEQSRELDFVHPDNPIIDPFDADEIEVRAVDVANAKRVEQFVEESRVRAPLVPEKRLDEFAECDFRVFPAVAREEPELVRRETEFGISAGDLEICIRSIAGEFE